MSRLEFAGNLVPVLAEWRKLTEQLTKPEFDKHMDGYSYFTEALLLEVLNNAIKGTPWVFMFGEPTAQIADRTNRVVTIPLFVASTEHPETLLHFWGVGEGTALNGCHVLGAATTARRQAILGALGWLQSSDKTDGEFKHSKRSDNQPAPQPTVPDQAESQDAEDHAKAQEAYRAAKTIGDLVRTNTLALVAKNMNLNMDDVIWWFTPLKGDIKDSKETKKHLVDFMKYVERAKPLLPQFVAELAKRGLDTPETIRDLSIVVNEILGNESPFIAPLDDTTLQLLSEI